MPAGFGYGAVGKSLMGIMRGAATGAGGRTLQGATIGAGLGSMYGAFSDRQTIVGGMMGGALRGGMLGGAFAVGRGAFYGRFASPGSIAKMAARNPAYATMSPWGRARSLAMGAGRADFTKAMSFARSSYAQVAGTWGKAANPIPSTMKTTGISRMRRPLRYKGAASATTRRGRAARPDPWMP